MRLTGLMLVVGLVAMVSASAALGADMMAAAKTELGTALTHAGFAAQYDAVAEVELHLHHVVNCLEGSAGKNYNMGAGNVCQGQGNGIFADLKDSGMAGAHAAPYAQDRDQAATWGITSAMAKERRRAEAPAGAQNQVMK